MEKKKKKMILIIRMDFSLERLTLAVLSSTSIWLSSGCLPDVISVKETSSFVARLVFKLSDEIAGVNWIMKLASIQRIYIYFSVRTSRSVCLNCANMQQIRGKKLKHQHAVNAWSSVVSAEDHARSNDERTQKACVGPCPTLRQNRTEHTHNGRGVRQRRNGSSIALTMWSTKICYNFVREREKGGEKKREAEKEDDDIRNDDVRALHYFVCVV